MEAFLAEPAAKAAGIAIALLLIVIFVIGVYASGFSRGGAACKASAAQAVLEAQQKADKLQNQILAAQDAAQQATEKTVTVYRDRIVNAPATNSCGPAVRAAVDGVRVLLRGDAAAGK